MDAQNQPSGSDTNPPAALSVENRRDLSPWEWLGIPLAILAYRMLSPLLGHDTWKVLNQKEFGVLELATVAMLLVGLVTAWRIWKYRDALPRFGMTCMVIGGLCVFYFLGEEISWGQHYLGYETPESVRATNEQEEFNLHNMAGTEIFDNIPRQAMLLGTLIGGIILPLVFHKRLKRTVAPRKLGYWLIPNYRIIPVAVFSIVSTVPEKIADQIYGKENLAADSYWNMALVDESGELKELLFAGVMAFFLHSVLLRLSSMHDALRRERDTT